MGAPEIGPVSVAIFRVARLRKSLAGRLPRETGLHPGQELILMWLWSWGPGRQVDLVRALRSDPPTIARSIVRLEKAGLVRRSPSPTDGRAMIVEPTQESLVLQENMERVWAELERLTTEELTHDQRDEVVASLALLEHALEGERTFQEGLTADEGAAGDG